jgi:hypothetical protein
MRTDTHLAIGNRLPALLFLFRVFGVFSESGAVFFKNQLFPTRFSPQGVIVVARFLANQEHGFGFFLAFRHSQLLTTKQSCPAPRSGANQLIVLDPARLGMALS